MKSLIRLDPVVYSLRVYKNEVCIDQPLIDEKNNYDAVATVCVQGAVATISAMHGEFSRDVYRAMEKQFKSMGVSKVIFERHYKNSNKVKVVNI